MELLAVMAGGACGALLRYGCIIWITSATSPGALPVATLCVNIIGSFLIGILASLFIHKSYHEWLRLFFIIGVLGSYTTVSGFSYETLMLLMQGQYLKGLFNALATVILCIGASWCGLMIMRIMFS